MDHNFHDGARKCLMSNLSVYPVVGVRHGATGPGRRPCATPVQEKARFLDANVEFTDFNW